MMCSFICKNIIPFRNDFQIRIYIVCKIVTQALFLKPSPRTLVVSHDENYSIETTCEISFWFFVLAL